jgi:hypothetical protein
MAYTDCIGPKIKSAVPVTTKTIVNLIDELHQRFGPGYTFVPEPITEGGIKLTTWPNKKPQAYKTVRFKIGTGQGSGSWPQIGPNTLEQWRQQPEMMIWSFPRNTFVVRHSNQVTGCLYLKALYGAPCWTPTEVEQISEAFRTVGFVVNRMTQQDLRQLRKTGDLGVPHDSTN